MTRNNTVKVPSNVALLDRYLKHLSRTHSPNTVYLYARDLEKYVDHLGSTHLVRSTVDDMYSFVDRPRSKSWAGIVAPATIRREMMELQSFYGFLVKLDLMPANLAAKLDKPTVHNELPHPVPDDVWLAFWSRGDLSDDLRVACGLGYFAGLRRHEITLLRPDQFTFEPRLVVTHLKRKGGKRPAVFPLGSCVAMYAARLPQMIGDPERTFLGPLRRLLKARAGMGCLFPWDGRDSRYATRTKWLRPEGIVDPITFNRRLTQAKAGFSPHDLRHSFCTNMVRPTPKGCGVALQIVSKLASHTDPRVTMRYLEIGADPLADLLIADEATLSAYGPWG